jgi:glycosyltransferase involved in cell wall biosynthesis
MYSIMSSARPILAVMEREAWGAQWIEEHRLGSRVDPGDGEGLARAILDWKSRAPELEAAGQRGRRLLEERYAIGTCGASFATMFKAVVAPRDASGTGARE